MSEINDVEMLRYFILTLSHLILSQTNLGFYVSAAQILRKHLGKAGIARNEKFLLFPVFYPFGELSAIFEFEFVICKLLQFGRVKNLVIWGKGQGGSLIPFISSPELKVRAQSQLL